MYCLGRQTFLGGPGSPPDDDGQRREKDQKERACRWEPVGPARCPCQDRQRQEDPAQCNDRPSGAKGHDPDSHYTLHSSSPSNGPRLGCSALKKDSFPNLRAATFKRVLDGVALYLSSPAA